MIMQLLPPVLVLITLGAMMMLGALAPGPLLIDYPYSLVGIVFAATGFIISFAGSRQFARVGTNIRTFDEPVSLVTGGLFRLSRNPMYLGFVILLFGTAVLIGTTTPFMAVALFAIVTDRWYIAYEERAMAHKFGADYAAYAGHTRRWL
jgi:protein-S-isoprenylcysteine O-methyltransferase Ste14